MVARDISNGSKALNLDVLVLAEEQNIPVIKKSYDIYAVRS